MKQVQEHISVPLSDLQSVLDEVGECRVLNVRMYQTYKNDWLMDVTILIEDSTKMATLNTCHECHQANQIRKDLSL